MRSGARVLLIIRAAFVSATKIPASLCLLSLPHLHANPAGTTGGSSHSPHFASTAPMPTRPPPQSIEMRRPAPTLPPFVLAVSFLHICMILATQHALRVPVSKRINSHLYVLSNVPAIPIFCAEQSLDFPFSSAFLIGGTGCLYYRSSTPGETVFVFDSMAKESF